MKKVASFVVVLLMAVGLAACGDDDPAVETDEQSQSESDAPGENKVSIIETNYAFQVSGPVKAGTVSLEVTNEGTEFHETAFVKLLDGKTIEDMKAALDKATPDTENPFEGVGEEESAMDGLGNAQTPGSSLTLTRDGVEAGEYAIICFIPNAEGESHFKLGMLSSLTVEEGDVTGGPEADHTLTATDDKIDGPDRAASRPDNLRRRQRDLGQSRDPGAKDRGRQDARRRRQVLRGGRVRPGPT